MRRKKVNTVRVAVEVTSAGRRLWYARTNLISTIGRPTKSAALADLRRKAAKEIRGRGK
jgi:hypothetical protein